MATTLTTFGELPIGAYFKLPGASDGVCWRKVDKDCATFFFNLAASKFSAGFHVEKKHVNICLKFW